MKAQNLSALALAVSFAMIPMQNVMAQDYVVGGLYTYNYHDGRYADWGDYGLRGAQMAVDDFNASKRLGDDRLVMPKDMIIDYHCWPDGVADHAKNLIKKGAIAITGCDCSSPATEVAKVATELKIPAVSYGANSSNLSSVEDFPFFYRNVTPSSNYEGLLLDVAHEYGMKDLAVFFTTDAWGSGAAGVILEKANKLGMNVTGAYGFPRNTSVEAVQKYTQEVKDSGTKAIIVAAPTPDTVTVFKTITNLDMNKPGYMYLAGEMVSADEKPRAINGVKGYIAPMTKLVKTDKLMAFHDRFEKAVGKKVDPNSKAFFYAVLAYDHMWAVGEALDMAKKDGVKEITGEVLMPYLRKVDFDGLSGRNNMKAGTNDRESMSVELMNCQGYYDDGKTVKFVPVGYVDSNTGKLKLQKDTIIWPGMTKEAPGK